MLTALKEQTANSVVQCIAQVISAKKKKEWHIPVCRIYILIMLSLAHCIT